MAPAAAFGRHPNPARDQVHSWDCAGTAEPRVLSWSAAGFGSGQQTSGPMRIRRHRHGRAPFEGDGAPDGVSDSFASPAVAVGVKVERAGAITPGKPIDLSLAACDVDGRPWRHASGTSSSPPAFDVGERVFLLYDPADPSRARIDSFVARRLLPAVFGGLGACLLYTSRCV